MKKASMILTLAFGLGILSSSAVQAIHPMQFPGITLYVTNNMILEEEITLQDWMLTPESFSKTAETFIEKDLIVEGWMLERSWDQNDLPLASESEISLEEWMLRAFDKDNRAIALKD